VVGTGPSKFAKDQFTAESKDESKPVEGLNQVHKKRPVILCMGSEGDGLRLSIVGRADSLVTIPNSNPESVKLIDSLNVGVATGVLLHAINNKSAHLTWTHRTSASPDEGQDYDEDD
jgi:tRNA G18 (ribose-2'-O)-methylase SpoU